MELSTETPTISYNAKTHHRTIAPTEQYKRVNRGYKLREDLIKACKLRALEEDKMLYQVMEQALLNTWRARERLHLEKEIQHLQERLNIEELFRTDTAGTSF